MARITLRLFAAAVAAAALTNAALVGITVASPRQVNPAFVEPGDTFVAEVEGSSGLSAGGWSAAIRNDLRSWSCAVVSASTARIKHGTLSGWRLTLRVPADAPPELFTLEVSHASAGTASRSHAVSVVKDLEAPFYILQMTDEHAKSRDAYQANGHRSAELVSWAAPVINLINPRFVLNSGDDSGDWWDSDMTVKLQNYRAAKKAYRVPTITVPGNHDVPTSSNSSHALHAGKWDREMGYRTFSSRLGSFYVLAHDYFDASLKQWAAAEWTRSLSDASVKYRLITQHFTDTHAFKPGSGQYPNLMLIGHLHYNNVVQTTPYPLLITVAALDYARAGFLEFKRTSTGGWYCPSVLTHDNGSNQVALVGDWGAPKVEATYAKANDGTQTSNSVSVQNQLGKDFNDGRVRFLLQAGTYAVSGGQKLAEYAYSGGTKTAVLVKVNLARNATTSVSITRSGGGGTPTAVTRSFQDGVAPSSTYFGTRDTYISSAATTANYGAATTVLADGDDPNGSTKDKNALIKWDVSSIPPGSAVQSAKITINVVNSSPQAYELYRVAKPWVEREATWLVYKAGATWEVAGAKGASDRGTTVRGVIQASSTGAHGVTLNSAGVQLVQSWVDHPSWNHGFIITDPANTDGVDFSSREAATATLRPRLTVTYVPPSTATAVASSVETADESAEAEYWSAEEAGALAAQTDGASSGCGATGLEAALLLGLLAFFRRGKR